MDDSKSKDATKNFNTGEETSEKRIRRCIESDRIDEKFGFERVQDYKERVGFLINLHPTEISDENKRLIAALDLYFIQEDGARFKATITYDPYFFVLPKKEAVQDVMSFLAKKYAGSLKSIDIIRKEDLDLPNHLIGLKQHYLKLTFPSITELMKVRKDILSAVRKSRDKSKVNTVYTEMMSSVLHGGNVSNKLAIKRHTDQLENIVDIREYDVPYLIRVSIDLKIFVGAWYSVVSKGTESPVITKRPDLIETPDLIVLAFDIECTKQPLKFPDAQTDEIMMISYMIDGQGYLINNREIISEDVSDFEYTPNPEFEGNFTVFNEPDEKSVLERFFEHICDVKPHVIATYNGDFFDWPFVEARALTHGFNLQLEIGFSKNRDGVYFSRPIIHMDCLCWVKRDSYLPVGSQNLKAVAKAKLRYDPVELDPEDMCRLAAEEPQSLCNYSVSDAVATYYLYMKYVHPFIFALCTIIPMEPDDVLRKGSGTLCEALLMVQAFQANIIFPNKQEQVLNKMTNDGHVIESETYVGGHVEALESGVFRADLPSRFKLVPEAFDMLISGIESTLIHAIEVEEQVPLSYVTNLDETISMIREKLVALREQPIRVERPVIYHLDVGAMYPNIILTNRLQPSAIVNEEVCASCDFNRPGATCQRQMTWSWRGELMRASRNEFLMIQQQLEMEKFPSNPPGGPPRAFHQLSKEEQAAIEKKRLDEYCRKAYKKLHMTKMEERIATICQKENSFYVDTVRSFRDLRYEYKALAKDAKKQVQEAVAKGDARQIKSAKNREVLYDSLQLAHKCILNSFYGYVMRKGARWHSMEMAGVVCNTGGAIIRKAREIIEQVGRPLELDTDGIWCILPSSFPENFTILTTHEKKKKLTISYPNAVLNRMVKEHFTNDAYHELVDKERLKYEQRSENTIFFEVDGPYLAMVLPASKEEGKKLKKRYAVFNFDKSLAELKGFEVKRRGELQLIKIFQSSVFESFLKGDSLEDCYAAVAKVADYWLDVLYTKAYNLPDSELFALISENRSMSRKLEDYGAQKSTSISTAKRLAEFLGDQMVKDKGLACRYIISKKPEGAPVTERAVPLAIFQSEPSIKRHYLRKWLKDSSLDDVDIREVLDWNYYIERLSGAIQKIITIPAALQGLNNPVPRVRHPDWLYKKILEKNDVLKQRKVNEFFKMQPKKIPQIPDIENANSLDSNTVASTSLPSIPIVNRKRKRGKDDSLFSEDQLCSHWKDIFGPSPPFGKTREEHLVWLEFHKKKWAFQLAQKEFRDSGGGESNKRGPPPKKSAYATMSGFVKSTQRTILRCPWQVIQYAETQEPGLFRVWALVENELHAIKLVVPRIFYVNRRVPHEEQNSEDKLWKPAQRILPRSRPVHHLYEYSVPEREFQLKQQEILQDLSSSEIEGIYEMETPLEFRLLVTLGCICVVDGKTIKKSGYKDSDHFEYRQLIYKPISYQPYLEKLPDDSPPFKTIFLYQHHSANAQRSLYAIFVPPVKKAFLFVLDSVRTINKMPNLKHLYQNEKVAKQQESDDDDEFKILPEEFSFDVEVTTDARTVFRGIQRVLQTYRDEKRGPTVIVLQTAIDASLMLSNMPGLNEFPIVRIHLKDPLTLYSTMEWQRDGAKYAILNFLELPTRLALLIEQCKYFHIPIGNIPADSALFGVDLFYARHLMKHNHLWWCSPSPLPDLGGRQADDARLLTELDDTAAVVINSPGAYATISADLDVCALAVCALCQAHRIHDVEGTSASIAFDANPQGTIEEMLGGATFTSYDESALCQSAFRILRFTVTSWLSDISKNGNVFSDTQATHFYRWIQSPNALLYDPALRRTLYGVMKKLFAQLVAEIKRLGSTIVVANFNRIIIATKKHFFKDALGYVQYVIRSIQNKELFHIIKFKPLRLFDYLLWLDEGNFAGVKIDVPDNFDDEGSIDELMSSEEEKYKSVWSISEYLPVENNVQLRFMAIIADYIAEIRSHLKAGGRDEAVCTPQRADSQQIPTQTYEHGVGALENVKKYAVSLIQTKYSNLLYEFVDVLKKRLPVASIPEPGGDASRKRKINPALEFTKTITKVLSLDKSIADDVESLKRNMLRLIGVGEFSPAAEWCDPCASIVVPEVICTSCNTCRDIDVCKDPYRSITTTGKAVWYCPLCPSVPYDNSQIEHLLLDAVQRKIMAFTLQDLICAKCHQIQADNMSERCTCAGNFQHLIPVSNLENYLELLEGIAGHFQLELLLNTIQWLRRFCKPTVNT